MLVVARANDGTDMVREILVVFNELTWPIAQEDFIVNNFFKFTFVLVQTALFVTQ
jgi:hypothetical protein